MKIPKKRLKRIIREEHDKVQRAKKDRLLRESGSDLDHDTKASMVLEAVQQNLNDPNFINWLFDELGTGI